jgi:exonuclease III
MIRIVSWNIRAGGGHRAIGIAEQLIAWRTDIACLCEFRATPPSQQIVASLADEGLRYQLATTDTNASTENGLLIAARWPISCIDVQTAPDEPRRWLPVRVVRQSMALCLVHIPNLATGRKWAFLSSIASALEGWVHGPALLIGDTNCGWPADDEESPVFGPRTAAWLDSIEGLGWRDCFRALRAGERFFTWYSPNAGNGFRLDQAFANRELLPSVKHVDYRWGQITPDGRRDSLSDHAALIIELDSRPHD